MFWCLAVHVVRPEDHRVHPEHLVRGAQIELDRVLGDAVRILRLGNHVLPHRQLTGAVDGDRRREDEALHLGLHGLVDERHGPDDVVRVVEAADEVGQPLGRVRRKVVDVVEAPLGEELPHERGVGHGAFDEPASGRNVVLETAAQVVENRDFIAPLETMTGHMRADETGPSRD